MVDAINQFSQICPSLVAVGIVSVYGRIDAGIMLPPCQLVQHAPERMRKMIEKGETLGYNDFSPNVVGEICLV